MDKRVLLFTDFHHKHDDLEMEVLDCMDDFKSLKAAIFNFVVLTLKMGAANLE